MFIIILLFCPFTIMGKSSVHVLDTVSMIGYCNRDNTFKMEIKTPEEMGQKLLENIESM